MILQEDVWVFVITHVAGLFDFLDPRTFMPDEVTLEGIVSLKDRHQEDTSESVGANWQSRLHRQLVEDSCEIA